ncbi:MAG: hypothetical protein WA383_10975 [Terriglobales bacterium]
MFLGCAISVDRALRTEGREDWWADEELSAAELSQHTRICSSAQPFPQGQKRIARMGFSEAAVAFWLRHHFL